MRIRPLIAAAALAGLAGTLVGADAKPTIPVTKVGPGTLRITATGGAGVAHLQLITDALLYDPSSAEFEDGPAHSIEATAGILTGLAIRPLNGTLPAAHLTRMSDGDINLDVPAYFQDSWEHLDDRYALILRAGVYEVSVVGTGTTTWLLGLASLETRTRPAVRFEVQTTRSPGEIAESSMHNGATGATTWGGVTTTHDDKASVVSVGVRSIRPVEIWLAGRHCHYRGEPIGPEPYAPGCPGLSEEDPTYNQPQSVTAAMVIVFGAAAAGARLHEADAQDRVAGTYSDGYNGVDAEHAVFVHRWRAA